MRMPLLKSDKARLELASKQRFLSVRERSALFLADGIRSRDELVHLLQGDVGMLQKLMEQGYLVASETLGEKATRMTDFAVSQSAPLRDFAPSSMPAPLDRPAISNSGFTGMDTITRNVTALVQSADSFEGKRSLATTRMFLFDIVERMFVRKMPELANHLRDQLREARDRESMMVIAREIITNVEEIAGPDRADGLSERLAMMLPPE
jgi:hypothetical protein